jgi:hypothetical protein
MDYDGQIQQTHTLFSVTYQNNPDTSGQTRNGMSVIDHQQHKAAILLICIAVQQVKALRYPLLYPQFSRVGLFGHLNQVLKAFIVSQIRFAINPQTFDYKTYAQGFI